MADDFVLNEETYYSAEADKRYLSFHQYMSFCGGMLVQGCEAKAMAVLKGEWKDEVTLPLLVGGYVDAYFDHSLDKWKAEHPECFTAKGELKAPYKQAEKMIEVCKADDYFMNFMSGQTQTIMTFYWAGANWKMKMDSYIPDKLICDSKTTASMKRAWKIQDYGYVSFCEAFFYTGQLALYQKGVEINTGKKLPCFIAAVEKSDSPDHEIISIPQQLLDNALNTIEMNVPSILAVKNGEIEPIRCENCNYCRMTKKLKKPISLMDLINDY